jgi:arylsulfatase
MRLHIIFGIMAAICLESIAASDKPNIILILADDLGWSDLGCYGGEIQTPNLDSLASGGIRFTQFYNAARCCPSRASLLTGLHPHQAGVGAMSDDMGPDSPGYRGTIQADTVTLAEVLREAGYHTSMVGKWHLHNNQNVKPTDRGFDEFYGMLGGYNSCWQEKPFYTRLPADRKPRPYTSASDGKPGTFYATDIFADYSIDFIKEARNAGKSFFLYLAFNAPHFPLHAYETDIAKYEATYFEKGWDAIRENRLKKQKKLGLVPKDLELTPRSIVPAKSYARNSPYAEKSNPAWNDLPEDRRRDLARRMAVYAAMIDRMDSAIGRVMDDLKSNDQFDNTLIIFLSDNGACWEWSPYGFDNQSSIKNILHKNEELKKMGQPGDYISYGSAWANASNTPWRMYKHFNHEGGIRTPFIVHWPSSMKETGSLRSQPCHLIDLMPTLIEVAGAFYPEKNKGIHVKPMEGINLLPILSKNVSTPRNQPLFFEHQGSRAVRDGRWKLVSMTDDAWELYDMDNDPTEMRDLMKSCPDVAQNLITKWNEWALRCGVDTRRNLPRK